MKLIKEEIYKSLIISIKKMFTNFDISLKKIMG